MFAGINEIQLADEPDEDYYSNHWLSTLVIDSNAITREDMRIALQTENIDCRPVWKPMHLQPVFAQSPYYGDNVSEKLFEKGLCLPSGSNLSDTELGLVSSVVLNTIAAKKSSVTDKINVYASSMD